MTPTCLVGWLTGYERPWEAVTYLRVEPGGQAGPRCKASRTEHVGVGREVWASDEVCGLTLGIQGRNFDGG